MSTYQISINPFAEYLEATANRRIRILEEQQKPDLKKVTHYQLAKARIKKSVELSGGHWPINDGIRNLKERKPNTPKQKSNIVNSIIVLEKYKQMALSDLIKNNKLELITPTQKHINFHGITINVAPNSIFRVTIDGVKYIGAFKIHVSKGKPFSYRQSKLVANIIEQFLSNCVVGENEQVEPALCFCLDPFAGTTINSFGKPAIEMKAVKQLCNEIKQSLLLMQPKGNVA